MRPSDGSPRQGASGMRHKTLFRVHCPVPGPSRSDPPGVLPGKVDKICGGHGQGETPGPIPNPEAKALHGDGTAPERVWESSAPPLSHDTVPPGRAPSGSRGVPRFPPPRTRGRAGRRSPDPADAGPSLPHIFIFIHPFVPPFPFPSSFLFLRSSPRFFFSFPLLSCPTFLPFPTSPAFLRPRPATSLLSFLRHRLFPSPAASPRFLFALPSDSRIPAFCLFRSSSAIIGF